MNEEERWGSGMVNEEELQDTLRATNADKQTQMTNTQPNSLNKLKIFSIFSYRYVVSVCASTLSQHGWLSIYMHSTLAFHLAVCYYFPQLRFVWSHAISFHVVTVPMHFYLIFIFANSSFFNLVLLLFLILFDHAHDFILLLTRCTVILLLSAVCVLFQIVTNLSFIVVAYLSALWFQRHGQRQSFRCLRRHCLCEPQDTKSHILH